MIYNYPQVRYTANHPASKSLAQVFQAPFNLISKPPQKSLRHLSTTKFDVPMLVYEGGESLRFDEFSIQTALEGIQRIFAHFGMLEYVKPANSTFYNKSTWIRASHAGLFATIKKAGQQVAASEIIGWINDPQGTTQYPVKSTKDGVLIAHNNKPVIHQGDALFHIAY